MLRSHDLGLLFGIVLFFGGLGMAMTPVEEDETGKTYHYSTDEVSIKCVDGKARAVGAVRYDYKVNGESVKCRLLDSQTGRAEFTIPVQTVTIVRK